MFQFPGSSSSGGGKRSSGSGAKGGAQKEGNNASTSSVGNKTNRKKKNDNFAKLPDELRKLRACMICSLIKTESQFEKDGCDNCESFLQLAGTRGSVSSYTSGNYEGMIGMMNSEDSWVARWQRTVSLKPGIYAVNVRGKVENWVKSEMEDAGIPYYCRDKTMQNSSQPDEDRPKKRRTRRPTVTTVESIEDEENSLDSNAISASRMNELCIDDENASQVGENNGDSGNSLVEDNGNIGTSLVEDDEE